MRTARAKSLQPAIQLLSKGVIRLEGVEGQRAVAYRLTRSRRARYVRLTINRFNEVVLTIPAGCSPERGLRFMRMKSEWLLRHLRANGSPETLHGFLRRRGFVAVDGGKVMIDWKTDVAEPFLRHRPGMEKLLLGFDFERHEEADLKDILRQFAAETLSRRTFQLAAMRGLPVNKVSVRDQISRWGSCSAKRNLSLNWRLLLLPPEIKDYVIWHELAHLVEMNHSHRFWKALADFDPRALHHDNVLTQITNRIMAIGRSPK